MPYRSRNVRSTPQRRKTAWVAIDPTATTMVGAGGTFIYAANAALDALRPYTIVRTIMDFLLVSDQAAAIENQICAFGWAVVSDQASAAGVASLPTPVTDLASDLWFFHRFVMADESNLTDRTKGGTVLHVESKAMRKVDVGQDIAGVGEFSSIGEGCELHTAGRMLVKLH